LPLSLSLVLFLTRFVFAFIFVFFCVSLPLPCLISSISQDNLVSMGTCFGKFTKSGKFRLHITCLDKVRLVLSRLVSSCLVLSRLVVSRLVSSRLVLSSVVQVLSPWVLGWRRTGLVLPCPLVFWASGAQVLSCLVSCCMVLSCSF
jgi:hypothetical protein